MHIMSVCRKFPHRALKLCRCVLTGWGMREHSNLERKAVPNLLRPPNGMSACTAIVLPGTQRSSVPPCPTIDHHYRLCSCKSDQGSNENSSCNLSCFEKYALTSFVDATTQAATECWTALKNSFFPWCSEKCSEWVPTMTTTKRSVVGSGPICAPEMTIPKPISMYVASYMLSAFKDQSYRKPNILFHLPG